MTIEDPTLSTLASYDMSGGEAFMGSILLASTILLEMLNSVIPKVSFHSLLNLLSGLQQPIPKLPILRIHDMYLTNKFF